VSDNFISVGIAKNNRVASAAGFNGWQACYNKNHIQQKMTAV